MRSLRGALATIALAGGLACTGCGSVTDANVIRGWADALAAGDVGKAASYFALPAIVANGTPPVRITSRAQAREFNALLPCGARLIATARHGIYTYATFRLIDRVGGDCGAGTGSLAATAFRIRDGKIAEWLRLPDAGSGQPPPSAPPPAPSPGQAPSV
jgi:hypothetical protein